MDLLIPWDPWTIAVLGIIRDLSTLGLTEKTGCPQLLSLMGLPSQSSTLMAPAAAVGMGRARSSRRQCPLHSGSAGAGGQGCA